MSFVRVGIFFNIRDASQSRIGTHWGSNLQPHYSWLGHYCAIAPLTSALRRLHIAVLIVVFITCRCLSTKKIFDSDLLPVEYLIICMIVFPVITAIFIYLRSCVILSCSITILHAKNSAYFKQCIVYVYCIIYYAAFYSMSVCIVRTFIPLCEQ